MSVLLSRFWKVLDNYFVKTGGKIDCRETCGYDTNKSHAIFQRTFHFQGCCFGCVLQNNLMDIKKCQYNTYLVFLSHKKHRQDLCLYLKVAGLWNR